MSRINLEGFIKGNSSASKQQFYNPDLVDAQRQDSVLPVFGEELSASSGVQLKKMQEHLQSLLANKMSAMITIKSMEELYVLQGYVAAVTDIKKLVDAAIEVKRKS